MASSSFSDTEDSVRYYPYRVTRSQSRKLASQPQSASVDSLLVPSQPIREKRLYLSSGVIDSARERLLTICGVQEEGYTGSNEITIKENVSLKEYLRYVENHEKTSARMYLDSGNVKMYEVPLPPHSRVAGRIIVLMGTWNGQDFHYSPEEDLILGQNTERKPDVAITPAHRPWPTAGQESSSTGTPYPSMVVEIGYSQSFPDLHRTAGLYFDQRTTIQVVLSIKIFGVRSDNTIALTASLYLRSSPTPLIPTIIISFGTSGIDANIVNYINGIGVLPGNLIGVGFTDPNNNNNYPPCNAANIPTYLLNIPGASLYDGVPANLRPVGFAAGFTLDLWQVQAVIRQTLNI